MCQDSDKLEELDTSDVKDKPGHLADEVSGPGGGPIRESAASRAQVHRLLQLRPLHLLLTALIPADRAGAERG